jgi:4-hydroxybutyrate CoA-transferase
VDEASPGGLRPSRMLKLSAGEAIAQIPPGARVLLPHGCMEPRSVYDAIRRSPGHGDRPITLLSGLQFGDYPFLGDRDQAVGEGLGGLGPGYHYVTWQIGPKIRDLMAAGRVSFLPLRYRDIPRVLARGGPLQPDVVVVQCTPPRRGNVNLGIVCSFLPLVMSAARLVIAEIHPEMPWTSGATELPADWIDLAVEATGPLGTLPRARADEVDRAIVERVLEVLPENPWVQLGVGAIPDATLEALSEVPGVRLHSGMLSDALTDFLDRNPRAPIVTGEVCGTSQLYERLDGEPRVSFQPTTRIHHLPHLSGLESFVSINSAVEVDLWGQVNGEMVDGQQISGVGGSLDFVEAARYSDGGLSVMALRSKARDRSRIVPRFAAGTAVTMPRFIVDVVVTEHGVARLTGLTLEERAAALIDVAAPEFRAELRAAAQEAAGGRR